MTAAKEAVCNGVYLIGNAALWVLAFGALGFVVGWVVGMLA